MLHAALLLNLGIPSLLFLGLALGLALPATVVAGRFPWRNHGSLLPSVRLAEQRLKALFGASSYLPDRLLLPPLPSARRAGTVPS